jgi:hypothetical protein
MHNHQMDILSVDNWCYAMTFVLFAFVIVIWKGCISKVARVNIGYILVNVQIDSFRVLSVSLIITCLPLVVEIKASGNDLLTEKLIKSSWQICNAPFGWDNAV